MNMKRRICSASCCVCLLAATANAGLNWKELPQLPPAPVSPADGPHGQWFGFHGVDLDAVVDLGREMPIHRLGAHFLQSTSVGIFLPATVEFAVSSNGKDFHAAAKVKPKVPQQKPGPLTETIGVDGLDVTARYVRVRAANVGRIPDWHGAKGLKAWLFVDEILVNPAR